LVLPDKEAKLLFVIPFLFLTQAINPYNILGFFNIFPLFS
jgi:hypothetical protein